MDRLIPLGKRRPKPRRSGAEGRNTAQQLHGAAARFQKVLEIGEGAVYRWVSQREANDVLAPVQIPAERLGSLPPGRRQKRPVTHHGHIQRNELLFGKLRHSPNRDSVSHGVLWFPPGHRDHPGLPNETCRLQGHELRISRTHAHAVSSSFQSDASSLPPPGRYAARPVYHPGNENATGAEGGTDSLPESGGSGSAAGIPATRRFSG